MCSIHDNHTISENLENIDQLFHSDMKFFSSVKSLSYQEQISEWKLFIYLISMWIYLENWVTDSVCLIPKNSYVG